MLYGRRHRAYPHSVNLPDLANDPKFREKQSLLRWYHHISHTCDQLLVSWRQEYLTELQETHKKSREGECWPLVGKLVLIHDDGTFTLWKLGRVLELYQGGDNRVRVVKIKISLRYLVRSVVKLYLLKIVDKPES